MLKKIVSRFADFIAVNNPQKRFKMANTAIVIIMFAYLLGIVEAFILSFLPEDIDFWLIASPLSHPSALISSAIPWLAKMAAMLGYEGGRSDASNTDICIVYIVVALTFLFMNFIAWIKMRKRKTGWAVFVNIGYTIEAVALSLLGFIIPIGVYGFVLFVIALPKIILCVIIWRGLLVARCTY